MSENAQEQQVQQIKEAVEKTVAENLETVVQRAVERSRMSSADIREVIHKTFSELGLDPKNPQESQRDFQYLRDWRQSAEEVRRKGLVALCFIFLSGLVSLILMGIKEYFK